ncbi:MAG: cupin domain-containing protein [Patescibacteria group bacterium]
MILRHGDLPLIQVHRVATGETLGTMADISEKAGLQHLRFHYEVLSPGRRSSPLHRHTKREEVVYVLEGTPTLCQGNEKMVLQPTDVAIFRPSENMMHSIVNESEMDVRMLVASATDGEDEVIYPE